MQRGLVGSEMCIRDRVSTQSTWGEMHVAINAASVLTDTVEISRVEIRSPHVLYEAGARGTNLQTIARHAGAEEKREAKAENAQKAEGKTGAGKKKWSSGN
eukprot:TRINITY_DN34907_c0_g1_i1.p4 TRINITY_DN34907_c0_g1~~TRINITY_DN34907_c0_g1_i1.p4  ORF type:complete len:101 (-),score=45.01 TRINITY_DN34907_c0_g1_i1:321-623(-)